MWASLSIQKHSRALARPGKRGPEATSAEWRNAPEARAYGKHAVVNSSVDLARMQAHTLVRAESWSWVLLLVWRVQLSVSDVDTDCTLHRLSCLSCYDIHTAQS